MWQYGFAANNHWCYYGWWGLMMWYGFAANTDVIIFCDVPWLTIISICIDASTPFVAIIINTSRHTRGRRFSIQSRKRETRPELSFHLGRDCYSDNLQCSNHGKSEGSCSVLLSILYHRPYALIILKTIIQNTKVRKSLINWLETRPYNFWKCQPN